VSYSRLGDERDLVEEWGGFFLAAMLLLDLIQLFVARHPSFSFSRVDNLVFA